MDKFWDRLLEILMMGMVMEMVMQMMAKLVPRLEEVQKDAAPLSALSNIQTVGTLTQTLMTGALAL